MKTFGCTARWALVLLAAFSLIYEFLSWRYDREVRSLFRTYAAQGGLGLGRDTRVVETKTIGPWWMSYPGVGGRWAFRSRQAPRIKGKTVEQSSVPADKELDELEQEMEMPSLLREGAPRGAKFIGSEGWRSGSYEYQLRVAKDAEGYWSLFEASQPDY